MSASLHINELEFTADVAQKPTPAVTVFAPAPVRAPSNVLANAEFGLAAILRNSKTYKMSEIGVAKRLWDGFGDKFRCVMPQGEWITWDGRVWLPCRNNEIQSAMLQIIEWMTHEIANAETEEAKARKAKGADDKDEDEGPTFSKMLRVLAAQSATNSKIKASVEIASYMPEFKLASDQLNKDGELFNAQDCIVNLRTQQRMPHDPLQYMTKISNAKFASTSKAENFRRTLSMSMQGDAASVRYVQKAMGLTLAGLPNKDQIYFFCTGDGSNGKGTHFNTMFDMMGTYALAIPAALLTASNNARDPNSATPLVAAMEGVRFLAAQELKKGSRWDEDFVKTLTGNDIISARDVYAKPKQFRPVLTMWVNSNYMPYIEPSNYAMHRRQRQMHWGMKYDHTNKDVNLPDKLEAEMDEILAFAVEGYAMYLAEGIDPPAMMLAAQEAFKKSVDRVGMFTEEFLEVQEGKKVECRALFNIYMQWTKACNFKPLGLLEFKKEMERKGYTAGRTNKAGAWLNVALKDNDFDF